MEAYGEHSVRDWKSNDFAAANRVRQPSRKVRLSLTNHSAGGLTGADFEVAAKFDEVAWDRFVGTEVILNAQRHVAARKFAR